MRTLGVSMVDDPNRTVHAQQAFEFSDVFGYKFAVLAYGQQKPRRLKLNAPEGMSTAGGRQARQSMVLQADDGESVVCGWVDVPQKSAEIRAFQAVAQAFEARYKRSFDLPKADYERMVMDLEGFLKIQKIDFHISESAAVPAPRISAPPAAVEVVDDDPPPQLGMALGMLGLGLIIGFGLGYLAFGM
ncbi:MAG: hypothetical protein IPG45_25340 [Deltaproteobacteria bacterium]|nr:hypothetical protein [Deltaproteobacteria bacterium]